ncbi:hypothetical protein [Halioxenophilus sp. WMMB6]|uniref:hypothetical protein n=1 Tax=Halioxenophilus sp. WMMB6 TaxID=3073815 RepID=UPI00295F554E|nr:hypothetical protein [Halioxenophilus sp. WMMB6]
MPPLLPLFRNRRRKRRHKEQVESVGLNRVVNLSLLLEERLLAGKEPGVGNSCAHEIVISLTTYDKRIDNVCLTIESLMRQTLKADRIVLNVAAQDFSPETLPVSLQLQHQRGLEIVYVDEDLGPYTKFFYTLQKYPDALVITADDDLLYPMDMVAQLYSAYLRQPDMIHCHRAHRILNDDSGKLLPYKQWDFNTGKTKPGLDIFPTGVGGVLYFPGCFHPDIFNKELFLQLAPNADDIWLKAMSLKNGTLCAKIADDRDWSMRFHLIPGSQKTNLKRKNKAKRGGNDEKIARVFAHYNLSELLSN